LITIEELLRKASSSLQKVSDTSRLDAEVLLSHSVGLSRLQLITEAKVLLTDAQVRDFEVLLERRLQRQPVAYIVGSRFFWDLEFEVSPDVLVPRPETEHLVEQVLVWARSVDPQRHLRILELGVGSGCIAVSVAHEMKREQRDFRIIAVDSSGAALEIARRNCERHSVLDCIQLLQSNWFEALDSSDGFDCIVSNPPYVADLAADLSPETRYEPPQALFAGPDGLSDLENILKQSPRWIRPGGVLLCEIGRGQASALKASCDKMSEYLGAQTLFVKDYAGVDRIFRVLFSSQEQSSQKFPGAWNEE
jgi:release factor glutamine methyltransferase